MARFVALLRAINLGRTRKVRMARLRELLREAGYDDVSTLLQSGNVVLATSEPAAKLRTNLERLLADEFGFEVPVIVRTRAQLAKVVERDPIPGAASTDPKRYQVTFFDARLPTAPLRDLDRAAWGESTFALHGRELYTWTPAGIQADRMLRDLGRALAGHDGTARNWNTIHRLLELAGD